MERQALKTLLKDMSLKEKVDQMLQLRGGFLAEDAEEVVTGPEKSLGITEEDVRLAGSILGTCGAEALMNIQKRYTESQPHHIPMLFMMDVIHGMKTIFPIPLGQGAMFEPELAEKCASVSAKEAAVSGIHVTFAPMADLVRDARWGRVMESTGEDPYLNGRYATALVKGFQGEDMGEPYKVCACVKHFAAYGGAWAGREYNTVELSEHTLREFYLPAYKEGIDAGAGMVMTAFNTVNGIPASTNKWLMRHMLREEMGFDGVLISDYSAILETIAHGYSEDERDAAKKALEAGVDIDMMTGVYAANLCRLVEEGEVDEALIDESVLRILELKNRLGLFEKPYKDANPQKEKELLLCKEHRQLALEAAEKSFVLLKNDGLLPIDTGKKIVFLGPYTNNKRIISSWAVTGDAENCVTIEEAARKILDPALTTYCSKAAMPESGSEADEALDEALRAAREADLVIMALGEYLEQSGESASRAMIDVPQEQMKLLRKVALVNENIAAVLFGGRPLDIRELSRTAKAVLEVWLPGTEGGHAIMNVLTGKVNPTGKLPMSFPYCVGQVPVHYNCYSTGRPGVKGQRVKFKSGYLDIPNEPLYPFGYGLSYTTFEISPVLLSGSVLTDNTPLTASVKIKNTGKVTGTEVVQLYIQDISASVVRPIKELKGFEKTELNAGEEKTVSFIINEPMLRFLRADNTVGSEAGKFRVWIGNSSATENAAEFRYAT